MERNYDALTVVQLKELLRKAGLKTGGLKADLIDRLREYEQPTSLAVERSKELPRPVSPIRARVPSTKLPRPLSPPREIASAPSRPEQEIIFDCRTWSFEHVQNELKKYNLKLTGSREELCDRLTEYYRITRARQEQGPVRRPSSISQPKVKEEEEDITSGVIIPRELPRPPSIPSQKLPAATAKGAKLHPLPLVSAKEKQEIGYVKPPPLQTKRSGERVVNLMAPQTFSLAECKDWTVVRLKEELKRLGLGTSGNKPDLCQRLADYYREQLPSTKELHNLIFDDPSKLNDEYLQQILKKKASGLVAVTGRIYKLISQGPQILDSYKGKRCQGNAYVFGPLLDVSEYVRLIQRSNIKEISFFDYDGNKVIWSQRLKEDSPLLYAHYDKNGDIDSLIVDDNCIFGSEL